MGYQTGPATITITGTGHEVEWLVDHTARTVTPVVNGVALGTWRSRQAAKEALQLVDVAAKTKRGK